LSLDIPYKFMISNDDKHLEEWVKTIHPDVIVVFSMSRLLKENIFSIPKFGTINLHPSYLPEYRGPNPYFWQYHDMVMNPGVTVHYINSGEDTGDIIYQERVRVDIGTKSPEISDKLITETGIKLILRALDSIKLGNAPRIKQPKHSPTLRARNLSAEDHKTIIDWQAWPIDRIWHILRGTESWLNAIEQPQGIYRGHRWSIMEYEKEIYEHSPYKLGSIQKDSRGFFIQCREGKIRVSVRFSLIKLVKGFVLPIIFRTV
jgi:methionyl-tRNA formyltransferase